MCRAGEFLLLFLGCLPGPETAGNFLHLLNVNVTSCGRTGKKRRGEERSGGGGKEAWREGGKKRPGRKRGKR